MPNVELKGPKGPQISESLIPTPLDGSVSGFSRGLAAIYGADETQASVASVAGSAIIGVIEEDAVSSELPIKVIEHGQAVVQIGAAVSAGAQLAVNASGQFVTAGSGKTIVGRALSGNPNAGDYILALVNAISCAVHA